MGRWLAPRLPGPQHWVVHDRDADLLELAPPPRRSRAATVETRQSDVTGSAPGDLAGASLVIASALLDLLTADELARMLGACTGRLPDAARADRRRSRHACARRIPSTRRWPPRSTPTSAAAACSARTPSRPPSTRSAGRAPRSSSGRARGASDAADADLTAEWFDGWIAAACEQEPALAAEAGAYRERRLAQAAAGELAVTVDHADLLVLP